MLKERFIWLSASLLFIASCAVGGSEPEPRPRRDAGATSNDDAGDELEGDEDGEGDDPEDGTGGNGGEPGETGGQGGEGGSGGAGGDDSGGAGGSGGSGGSGGGGVCEPPNGSLCDPVAQCGCAAGQNCDFLSGDGATGCTKSGTSAAYAKCDGASCQQGHSCVGGLCRPFCNTAADCPGPGRSCDQVVMVSGSAEAPIPGFLICSAHCNPMSPAASCGAGATCLAFGGNDQTDCFVAGTATGGSCAAKQPDECAPGYTCAGTGPGDQRCRKWCRVGKTDCGNCMGFNTKVFVDGVEYGVCS